MNPRETTKETAPLEAPETDAPTCGVTYWITGLPGAGKTTAARALWRRLHAGGRFVVFLDGDAMRRIFGARYGYGRGDRHALAGMYGALCRELSAQGADVVCATVSMFEDVRAWNREHIPRYREIYIRAPIPFLEARHPKGLYSAAREGRVRNVPGVDQAFEEPQAPDLVIEADGAASPEETAEDILRAWPDAAAEDALGDALENTPGDTRARAAPSET